MTRSTAVILSALFALALTACNDVHPTYVGRADPYTTRQIQFSSEELQNDTAISGAPVVTRDPSGYLIVSVNIRSAIDKDLHIDYQTTFFDAAGQVIETTEWHTVVLPANTPHTVTDKCTSPAAANFQMAFRYAK